MKKLLVIAALIAAFLVVLRRRASQGSADVWRQATDSLQ
jgi:hypothetical protein